MTLLQRILIEKRALMIPLALGLLLNIAAYAIVVRPLGVKSAGSSARAAQAAQARSAAEQDLAGARGLVASKARAEQELATFFQKVLPANQSAAVRMTYEPLADLAKKSNVKAVSRRWEEDQTIAKNARVARLQIHLALQGDYASLRQFIYEVERAPELVIIDNVTLAQTDPTRPLLLTLDLSSYYRLERNGT